MTFSIDAVKAALQKNKPDPKDEQYPVLKLHIPETRHVWLLSELFCERRNIAWGLFRVHGCIITEGFIDLNELNKYEPQPGMRVQIDEHFRAKHPLKVYRIASELGLHFVD